MQCMSVCLDNLGAVDVEFDICSAVMQCAMYDEIGGQLRSLLVQYLMPLA